MAEREDMRDVKWLLAAMLMVGISRAARRLARAAAGQAVSHPIAPVAETDGLVPCRCGEYVTTLQYDDTYAVGICCLCAAPHGTHIHMTNDRFPTAFEADEWAIRRIAAGASI